MSASSYVVLLKESHGKRLVPIMVGENEAMAIQYNHFKSTTISHPSIYNVMLEILERNELHITQVQISEFKEGNFFCHLLCENETGTTSYPIRVADGLVMAICANAPIYMVSELVKRYGSTSRGKEDFTETEPEEESTRPANKDELKRYLTAELERLMESSLIEENYEMAAKIQKELDRRKKI